MNPVAGGNRGASIGAEVLALLSASEHLVTNLSGANLLEAKERIQVAIDSK